VTQSPEDIWKVRSFREALFPIHTSPELLPPDPAGAAKALMEAGLPELLQSLHRENDPFYFRIECKSKMTLEARSAFARKLADTIEQWSGGSLINSTSDYEIEIRLIENREGRFFPCIKCASFADHRFDYRKNAISASIHPSSAALLMELAAPYLKENAQIIDPFCGVGTMLIERNLLVPAREMYATDIFGEAVEKGRENAALAGAKINFIHRDFFDFKHDYLFDEIVTNMPLRGKKTREEMDALYGDFFQKVLEITGQEATVVMYTNEIGFVKKQLRLRKQFVLLQETCIQSKTGFYLLVIGVKKG
jgi:23S rRNA G2445 N2-methylase RlmL